jgi:hypothetical protein
MKSICENLETLGINCIYFLNNTDCKIEFFYKGHYLATVECVGKRLDSHGLDNMLKGLETNYMWLGLYYKIHLRIKIVDPQINDKLVIEKVS